MKLILTFAVIFIIIALNNTYLITPEHNIPIHYKFTFGYAIGSASYFLVDYIYSYFRGEE